MNEWTKRRFEVAVTSYGRNKNTKRRPIIASAIASRLLISEQTNNKKITIFRIIQTKTKPKPIIAPISYRYRSKRTTHAVKSKITSISPKINDVVRNKISKINYFWLHILSACFFLLHSLENSLKIQGNFLFLHFMTSLKKTRTLSLSRVNDA